MKKFFLMLLSALVLNAAVHAQDSTAARHKDKSPAKEHRTDMMDQLNLTSDQKAKMQQMHMEQKAKIDSIRNSSMSEDEKASQMKALRESNRKAMDDMLTPEQKSKMQQMHTEQMEKRKSMKQSADSTHR